MERTKRYPECFPGNFETEILPKGAKEESRPVYRVMKSGTIDREGFISTYAEIQRGLIPPKKKLRWNRPEIYSTSCNMDYSEAQYTLDMFMRHHPKAIIAKGQTEGSCGPSQLTSEREERTDTHVDWWVYQDSEPQNFFREVKKDE
mgnify:FL=1